MGSSIKILIHLRPLETYKKMIAVISIMILTINAMPQAKKECGHTLDCSSLPSGWHSDPYNCRKYWFCDGNEGTQFTCDGEQLWDAEKHWCDLPQNVNCHQRPICDDCDENCHFPPTTTPGPNDCSQYCKSSWGDFKMGCCNTNFWKCANGKGTIYPCKSSATVFVERIDACDWKENVFCCPKLNTY